MSSDSAAIQVRNVWKTFAIYDKPIDRLKQMLFWRFGKRYYTEFHALRDVSFDVRRGECVGIVGRNGAGKSTLLQIITGTLQPTGGAIAVNGRVAALLELGSGFNMEFTGRENVYMNASILGLSREEIAARYQAIVDFADIGNFIDQPVKTYSSGMLVRLAFAVVAHVDADILIVDEALAVGDAFFQQKCMRFIRKFKEEHTILFVSHDTQAVLALCDRAVYLDRGGLIADGSAKTIVEQYLRDLYRSSQDVQSAQTETAPAAEMPEREDFEDMRLPYLNNSNLRNDIEVFRFVPPEAGSSCFGAGGANITNVQFLSGDGKPLSWIVGGEVVNLRITVALERECFSPIVGFTIKNRLGEDLFVDNTYLRMKDSPLHCDAGETIRADFVFRIPVLPPGQYTVSPAVADGTMEKHTQLQWIYDALVFESHASSALGLIGLNMRSIDLQKV